MRFLSRLFRKEMQPGKDKLMANIFYQGLHGWHGKY